jgi:hypothetical protein
METMRVTEIAPFIVSLMSCLALTTGCDPADAEFADEGEEGAVFLRPGCTSNCGVWLNTSAIGDHAFAALDLKKGKHDGVRLDRVLVKRANGQFVETTKVWAEDGEIKALDASMSYSGMQLLGSKWELTLVDGAVETPAMMWISSATMIGGGVWRYNFQHLDGNGAVANLCEPDNDGSTVAYPLSDVTVNTTTGDFISRQNTLYLACVSGAIGKAVHWGYAPWDIGVPEFEASVRVVRADYCGDGSSFTQAGTSLQLEDIWGVNSFGSASQATEALWGANGALCLGTPRLGGQSPITCGGVALPVCASNASLASTPGAMVWSKLAPQ